MNKKIKIILFTSITLNILFLSFHLGHIFGPKGPENFMKKNEEKIVNIVEKDKQQLIRDTFAKMRIAREEKFSLMEKELKNLENITTAKEFDKSAFLTELTKINEISNQTKIISNIEIAETLSKLNQKDRIEIVAQIKKNKPPHAR